MATWAEFEAAQPAFASRVRALIAFRKHLTMATLRRDRSPRISGTEVDSGTAAHRFLIDIQEAVITRLNEAGNRLVIESCVPSRGYNRFESE